MHLCYIICTKIILKIIYLYILFNSKKYYLEMLLNREAWYFMLIYSMLNMRLSQQLLYFRYDKYCTYEGILIIYIITNIGIDILFLFFI